MLGDIIKHLTPDRAFEDYYPKLHAIMSKLLANVEDFAALFSMVPLRARIVCLSSRIVLSVGQNLAILGLVPARERPSGPVQIDPTSLREQVHVLFCILSGNITFTSQELPRENQRSGSDRSDDALRQKCARYPGVRTLSLSSLTFYE